MPTATTTSGRFAEWTISRVRFCRRSTATAGLFANGIDGNSVTLLDLRAQYLLRLPHRQSVSVFVELFNALNKINYGNPTGNRNNANFMVPVEAGTMRSAQMGVRYTF